MATKWQRFAIDVPKKFKPKDRVLVAEKVIDSILKRTLEKGKDKNNKKFVPYEKPYAKKKGQTAVDLVLNFKMLPALQLLQNKAGKVVVGFKNGSKQNAKADGNIRGTYGQKKPIPGKARDFLGVPTKALNAIIEIVGADIEDKDNG